MASVTSSQAPVAPEHGPPSFSSGHLHPGLIRHRCSVLGLAMEQGRDRVELMSGWGSAVSRQAPPIQCAVRPPQAGSQERGSATEAGSGTEGGTCSEAIRGMLIDIWGKNIPGPRETALGWGTCGLCEEWQGSRCGRRGQSVSQGATGKASASAFSRPRRRREGRGRWALDAALTPVQTSVRRTHGEDGTRSRPRARSHGGIPAAPRDCGPQAETDGGAPCVTAQDRGAPRATAQPPSEESAYLPCAWTFEPLKSPCDTTPNSSVLESPSVSDRRQDKGPPKGHAYCRGDPR